MSDCSRVFTTSNGAVTTEPHIPPNLLGSIQLSAHSQYPQSRHYHELTLLRVDAQPVEVSIVSFGGEKEKKEEEEEVDRVGLSTLDLMGEHI